MKRFIITMQYNETWNMSIFLSHYSQYFEPENIYIIDHGSTDDFSGIYNTGVNKIVVPRDRLFSERSRKKLIKNLAAGLLEYYDYGVFVDSDELIYLGDLKDSDLDSSPVIFVAGFDVYYKETPEALRVHGLFNVRMCKPSIFREVPDWGFGFHNCQYRPTILTLPLAHTKYLFHEKSVERLRSRAASFNQICEIEKRNNIAYHWSQGEKAMSEFNEEVKKLEADSASVAKFEPIDVTSLSKLKLPKIHLNMRSELNEYSSFFPHYNVSKKIPNHPYPVIYDLTNFFPALQYP